jgi:hypothetical protein
VGFPSRQLSTDQVADPPLHSLSQAAVESPATRQKCSHQAAPRGHDPRRTRMHHDDQRGITTAEYAVGTAAGAGLAGLLFKLLTGGFGEDLIRTLFNHVFTLLGLT